MLQRIQQYLGKTALIVFNFLLLLIILKFFVIDTGQINGQSMENTFHDQDKFLINKINYLFYQPQRGDMVQFFDAASDQFFVKRVIGLPGETVVIKQGSVFIRDLSGQEYQLSEPYLKEQQVTRVQYGQNNEILAEPHTYVVLGDNRLFSHDSRDFGAVRRQEIQGKVIH